jgi:hypothetical protein
VQADPESNNPGVVEKMIEQAKRSVKWRVVGRSVQGATHIHNDLANQDAIGYRIPDEGRSLPVVLAVSDGHGGKKYLRSDSGSRLAVRSALDVLQNFYEKHAATAEVANGELSKKIKSYAEDWLPRQFETSWKQAVDDHVKQNPFTEEEYAALSGHGYVHCREDLVQDPYQAYGATLLSVLVAENWILYAQLGDGDILTVNALGDASRPIPPPADEPVGEETFSLCQPDAKRFFQIRFVPLQGGNREPVMILVSTDGLNKSYEQDEGFLKIGRDLLTMVREEGIDQVGDRLPQLLDEVSRSGSGDDISLGLIKRDEPKDQDTLRENIAAVQESHSRLTLQMDQVCTTVKEFLSRKDDGPKEPMISGPSVRRNPSRRALLITGGLMVTGAMALVSFGMNIAQMVTAQNIHRLEADVFSASQRKQKAETDLQSNGQVVLHDEHQIQQLKQQIEKQERQGEDAQGNLNLKTEAEVNLAAAKRNQTDAQKKLKDARDALRQKEDQLIQALRGR